METSVRLPQRIRNGATTWPSTFPAGYLPEEKTFPLHVHCGNFYNSREKGAAWGAVTEECIGKTWGVCANTHARTHHGILLGHKKQHTAG